LSLNAFVVGGAVRDELLGLAVSDRDWVVVGSTPEEMVKLGFRPVGKDFPVFIHPVNGEEYALARTERKTAKGYHGFSFQASPDVTLEEDLSRRDLTVNAIAKASDGSLIDPYNGIGDLQAKTFRHVSDAFKEDPVRILRLARFAARFADFDVHPLTMELMLAMVKEGEVDALVAERVWQEFSRGLMENTPSRMIDLLFNCGALRKLMPGIDCNFVPTIKLQLDLAAQERLSLAQRFALLAQHMDQTYLPALRLPTDVAELSNLLRNMAEPMAGGSNLSASEYAHLLHRSDAIRRPERFTELLQVLCIAKPLFTGAKTQWEQLAQAYRGVDAGDIATKINVKNGLLIQEAITQARLKAVESALESALEKPSNSPSDK
jgi:tRNA nucleotidyltransferase (CCA-adding enzyme)